MHLEGDDIEEKYVLQPLSEEREGELTTKETYYFTQVNLRKTYVHLYLVLLPGRTESV